MLVLTQLVCGRPWNVQIRKDEMGTAWERSEIRTEFGSEGKELLGKLGYR
jgi:hypothetical protein